MSLPSMASPDHRNLRATTYFLLSKLRVPGPILLMVPDEFLHKRPDFLSPARQSTLPLFIQLITPLLYVFVVQPSAPREPCTCKCYHTHREARTPSLSLTLSMSTTYLPSGCTLTSTLFLPISCGQVIRAAKAHVALENRHKERTRIRAT